MSSARFFQRLTKPSSATRSLASSGAFFVHAESEHGWLALTFSAPA